MADGSNPFASAMGNAFSPDRGGLTGFLGGLAGVPTQQQESGGATSDALSALADLKSQGNTPQQSLLKFFQTPAGHDFFTSAGPGGLDTLVKGMAATQNPAPTLTNVPQGSTLTSTDPNSGVTKTLFKNPKDPSDNIPEAIKSFNYFAQISGLPSAEIKRLAQLKIDPSQADKTTAEGQAVDKLVSDYGLAPETGEKIKAGVLKVVPLKNETGQDTGAVTVLDLSSPNAPTAQVINPGARPTGTTAAPAVGPSATGTTPETGAATGKLPATKVVDGAGTQPGGSPITAADIANKNPKYFGTKSDMFLASGIIPSALAGASSVTEQVNPGSVLPEGAKAKDRQTMIDTLRSDLAGMGQLGQGIGVNKGVLEGYLKLAPTGDASESPHQAVQKAIRLSEHINNEIEADTATYKDASLPLETRKAAEQRIQGWNRVKRDLPSDQELGNIEEAIRTGKAGAPTAADAAKTVMNAAGGALTEVKKQATQVKDASGVTLPGSTSEPDVANMSAQDLVKVDPRGLSRQGKILYMRRIDSLKRGK